LERVRRSYRLHLYGYLVMPEHVQLLLSEPQPDMLADALKSLKRGVSRRLLCDGDHFWQKRYYDFNIRNYPQFVEKLRYIHRNPLKAGLCERPEDWEWSSFRHYATGCEGRSRSSRNGRRENANQLREDSAQPSNCPTQAKTRLESATRLRLRRSVSRLFDAGNNNALSS
jgi:REP element-mobilizing transposase RayT